MVYFGFGQKWRSWTLEMLFTFWCNNIRPALAWRTSNCICTISRNIRHLLKHETTIVLLKTVSYGLPFVLCRINEIFSFIIIWSILIKISEVALDKNRAWCPQVGCETVCHICSSASISGPGTEKIKAVVVAQLTDWVQVQPSAIFVKIIYLQLTA